MRMPLLALTGLVLAACQPDSEKTNPAVATGEAVAEREAAAPAIEAAGYSGITELTKGEDGIWRAVASLGGQTQEVSVDYQGNVTGGSAMPDPALAAPGAPPATAPSTSPANPTDPPASPETPPANPSQE